MSIIKKKAGRISPVLMGNYDNTTTYRRLDWVYYGGTSYICKKNNTVGIVPSNTESWQKIVDEVNDMHITFSEMSERTLFTSGESLSAIIGKIKKYLSDLKSVAFTANYNDLSNRPSSLKNPNALNIKFNGTSQASYDGSAVKEVNVTPAGIGAVNTSTLLNTTEQITANTNANNITGALAAKAMMADYNNKISTINSNLNSYQSIMCRKFSTSWGNSLTVPVPLPHGLLLINYVWVYVIWVAGNAGNFNSNYNLILGDGNDIITVSCNKQNGELTIEIPFAGGITYIGR